MIYESSLWRGISKIFAKVFLGYFLCGKGSKEQEKSEKSIINRGKGKD